MAPFIFSVIASPELLVCNELATYRKISLTCENVAPGVIFCKLIIFLMMAFYLLAPMHWETIL